MVLLKNLLGFYHTDLRAACFYKEVKQLLGIVEIDETYIAGKEKNPNLRKQAAHKAETLNPKPLWLGAHSRDGTIVAIKITKVNNNIPTMLDASVDNNAILCCDGTTVFQGIIDTSS